MRLANVNRFHNVLSATNNRRILLSDRRLLTEQQRRLLFQDLYKNHQQNNLRVSNNGQSKMRPNSIHFSSRTKLSPSSSSSFSSSMTQTRGIWSLFSSPSSTTSEKEGKKEEIQDNKIDDGQLEKHQPQETRADDDDGGGGYGYDDPSLSAAYLAQRRGGFIPLTDCGDDEVLKIVIIPLGKLEENITWSNIDELFEKLMTKEDFYEAFNLLDRLCQELKHYQESRNRNNNNNNKFKTLIGAMLHSIIEQWSISDKHIREKSNWNSNPIQRKQLSPDKKSPSPSNVWVKISRNYHPLGIPISSTALDKIMKTTVCFGRVRSSHVNGPRLVDQILETMRTEPTLKPTIDSFNAAMSSWEAYAKDKYFRRQTINVSHATKRLLDLLEQARTECGEYGALPNRDTYQIVMRVLAYQGDGDKVEELLENLYGVYLDAIEGNGSSDNDNIKDYCPSTECFSLVLFAWSQSVDKSGVAAERASDILETMLELEANKELPGLEVTARCFDIVLKCWSQVDAAKVPNRSTKMQELYDRMVELSKTDSTKVPTDEIENIMRLTAQLDEEVTENSLSPPPLSAADRSLSPVRDSSEGNNKGASISASDLQGYGSSSFVRQEIDYTLDSPPIELRPDEYRYLLFRKQLDDGSASEMARLLWDTIMAFEEEAKSFDIGFESVFERVYIHDRFDCEAYVFRKRKEHGTKSQHIQNILTQIEVWYAALRMLLYAKDEGLTLLWLRTSNGALVAEGECSHFLKSAIGAMAEYSEKTNGDPKLMNLRQHLIDKNTQFEGGLRCAIFVGGHQEGRLLSSFINGDPDLQSLGIKSDHVFYPRSRSPFRTVKENPMQAYAEYVHSSSLKVLLVKDMRLEENDGCAIDIANCVINYNQLDGKLLAKFGPEHYGEDVFIDMTEDISVVDDTKELTTAELQLALDKKREYFARAIENNLFEANIEFPLRTLESHLRKARAKVEYNTTVPEKVYQTRITCTQGNIIIQADGTGETEQRSRSAAATIMLNKIRNNDVVKVLEDEAHVARGPWQRSEDVSVDMGAGMALHNICVNLMNGKLDYEKTISIKEPFKTKATYTQGDTTIVVEGTGESMKEAKNAAAIKVLHKLRDHLHARKIGIEETAAAETVR